MLLGGIRLWEVLIYTRPHSPGVFWPHQAAPHHIHFVLAHTPWSSQSAHDSHPSQSSSTLRTRAHTRSTEKWKNSHHDALIRNSGICTSTHQNETLILVVLCSHFKLEPWLVWLSGLNTGLRTKGSPVWFPVRAHAWVVSQVPSMRHVRGNHTLMFPSLLPPFPSF